MRINHNLAALNTFNKLDSNTTTGAKSLEKLSSGFRINRAGDDAAGLAISEKMRGQIKGLDQATRNAQDGISMIQTAEGALNETHSILQRMRELSVQASNETLDTTDRSAIGEELMALKGEVNRIATTTKFNGKSLLDGSLDTTADTTNSTALVGTVAATDVRIAKIDVSGAVGGGTTYTFTSATGSITLTSSSQTQTLQVGAMAANGTQTLNFNQLGIKIDMVATAAGAATDIATTLANAAKTIVTAAGTSSASLAIGANAGETMAVSFAAMSNTDIGGDIATLISSAANTVSTSALAQTLLTRVNTAITDVATQRAKLGASQNRLEHTINNLSTASENLTASESRIRDVDMAKEMMDYTKNNILTQAAQAMLAQANQAPQGVLQLLR